VAHLGQAGHGVLGGGGFADAAFSVDCNFSHDSILILIVNPAETSDRRTCPYCKPDANCFSPPTKAANAP
jgi:hypothetical protein